MNDGGVWVKMGDAAPVGAAVINDASSNYDNKDAGVTIDGKTYDIYTFTTATTTRSVRLTDEARSRITDEDLLMAVATTLIPDDFTGDPATLFDRKYRNQLRNAFDVTPAVDPGLTLGVDTPGFAEVLIVGGGAAGGQSCGGGGGAGGVFGLGMTEVYLDKTQTITVGAGGVKRGANASPGSGQSSAVGNFVALGGGAGATFSITPQPGGSGGGGNGADYAGDEPGAEPALTQGNRGGDGVAGGATVGGGGGGGAGTAGTNGSGSTAGNGGDGINIAASIGSSQERWVAGGGGAGSGGTAGKGGKGGGGDGIAPAGAGSPGEINTGGGGGGGGQSVTSGGEGGSGIVIVRVEI